jgi:alpha-glucosidase (family GH31 glycosyl hydrolase)
MRIHSGSNEHASKEPWLFLGGFGELIQKWLRFRHQMIPYIYSHSLKTSLNGENLVEPLYYYHPNDSKCYDYASDEYYFAKDLLVAPFTDEKNNEAIFRNGQKKAFRNEASLLT